MRATTRLSAAGGDECLNSGKVVGQVLDVLGAIEEVGHVIGQGRAHAGGALDGVGELGGVRGGKRDGGRAWRGTCAS
jgi:hypothetical protein